MHKKHEDILTRVEFLKQHQHLATEPFGMQHSGCEMDKAITSNCFGTVTYLLGIDQLCAKYAKEITSCPAYELVDDYISLYAPGGKSEDAWCFFPQDFSRPGYVDRRWMQQFAKIFFNNESTPVEFGVTLFYGQSGIWDETQYVGFLHGCVCLQKTKNDLQTYSQTRPGEKGGRFLETSLQNIIREYRNCELQNFSLKLD